MKHYHALSASTVLFVASLVAPGLAGSSGGAWAQESQLAAGGQAWGATAKIPGVASSGRLAQVGMGCSLAPAFKENAAPGLDLPPAITVGQIHSTAQRANTGSRNWIRTTSEIENISILGGLVTASAVKAVSTARHEGGTFNAHGGGSQFVDLQVAGVPIGDTPEPNTQIDLLGIGHVTFNRRTFDLGPDHVRQQTTMIRVVVTLENPLVPVGTQIVVASATTQIRDLFVKVGGSAHGGDATVGDTVLVGKLFPKGLPCFGTDGQWRTNSGAVTAELPGVLSAGEVVSRVKGKATPTSGSAFTESKITGVDVLAGLVTADVITSWSRVFRDADFLVRQVQNSEFVGLQVAGFPAITDDVPINTSLEIPGLGTLWLKRRITWPGAIQMRMVDLEVLQENEFGLPIGTRVSVGVSSARVRP